jgi:hypothetical protein
VDKLAIWAVVSPAMSAVGSTETSVVIVIEVMIDQLQTAIRATRPDQLETVDPRG